MSDGGGKNKQRKLSFEEKERNRTAASHVNSSYKQRRTVLKQVKVYGDDIRQLMVIL